MPMPAADAIVIDVSSWSARVVRLAAFAGSIERELPRRFEMHDAEHRRGIEALLRVE